MDLCFCPPGKEKHIMVAIHRYMGYKNTSVYINTLNIYEYVYIYIYMLNSMAGSQ